MMVVVTNTSNTPTPTAIAVFVFDHAISFYAPLMKVKVEMLGATSLICAMVLFGVQTKCESPAAFLDNLENFPVDGFERGGLRRRFK
jgi:hypothetical protein